MRGGDEGSGSLFSYVDLEVRVGKGHPLRTIRMIVNEALASLSDEFWALYSRIWVRAYLSWRSSLCIR